MTRKVIGATAILAVLTAAFVWSYYLWQIPVLLSLAITAGTFFYHFGMRIAVGYLFQMICHNRMNYRSKWFQPLSWEPKLYRILQVKKWKGKMPTYYPELFDVSNNSPEKIVQVMCQAEIGHGVEAVLSFLPLIAAKWFGAFPVFLITSILAAAFDLMLVVVQRYNRPRLMRLINRRS